MIDFIKTKRNYIISLAILFVFVSLSETTYSLFFKLDTTDEFNYNTGFLDLEFVESEKLVLENTFPINDSEGLKGHPYILKLKNTGTLPYLFDLKMLANDEDNSIDYKYIKVSVDDNLPNNLYNLNNVIVSNQIIYPNEEKSFNIKIWLDRSIPNNELGKSFVGKITTTGRNIYKTLDSSGANHPKDDNDLIPVYYSETDNTWHTADNSNLKVDYKWYDYDSKMWANAIKVKDSNKFIFDITRNNDIQVSDLVFDNGNVIIDSNYLDTGIKKYNDSVISNVFRIKFNQVSDKQYIISNGNISYYYDFESKRFNFINNGNVVSSNIVNISSTKWYIIGYTYDKNNVKFYLDGNNIGTSNISGNIFSDSSFKLGTNNSANIVSNITIGNALIYNRILSDNEIKNNYSTSINIINNGLYAGYSEFMPMTVNEYYKSSKLGTTVIDSDIIGNYVWIPRFKYMVWNALGENNVDTYQAYQNGINITFENGTNTSGVIICQENRCYGDNTSSTSLTNLDNNKYYTHNAFSKINSETTGFWVSKYEISQPDNQKIMSVKGNNVLVNNNLTDLYMTIKNIDSNYHIIKNSEWGAISYLTHSKYGICSNNKCDIVKSNNSFISGNNLADSTTGNIYGVFDMAGSASEYVMTNYNLNNEQILDNAILKDTPISNDEYEVIQNDEFILGDATKELSLTSGIWNDDTVGSMDNGWFIRGGNATGSYKGIFAYGTSDGSEKDYLSTRIIIK